LKQQGPVGVDAPVTALFLERPTARLGPLASETDFYAAYEWSLDPHLTCEDAIGQLARELDRLADAPAGWQREEVATNTYLLSCSLLNGIDEYLRGPTLRLPAQIAHSRVGRIVLKAAGLGLPRRTLSSVRRWRQDLQSGLDPLFQAWIAGASDAGCLKECAKILAAVLRHRQPAGLLESRLGIPSAFSRLDMTHHDVLDLGREFVKRCPDRSQPILLIGLRTAGTYLSTLLGPYFKTEGYENVDSLTVHPKKGPSGQEWAQLRRYSRQGFTAVIVDDPPKSGATIFCGMEIAGRAGFDVGRIKVLLPEGARLNGELSEGSLISLDEKQWRKPRLLDGDAVEARLTEYFANVGYTGVKILRRRRLEQPRGGGRGAALNRIFEVRLESPHGTTEHLSVLAEGVGHGYLGYSAFIAAQRLSKLVPTLLGLRDGILYSEWFPQREVPRESRAERDRIVQRTAAYLAARTRLLSLPKHRRQGKAVHENGIDLLTQSLSRAYGRLLADAIMHSRIARRLCRLECPVPTLVDGNMDRANWIDGPDGPLKTGYHREGLGKTKLNLVDPAYDVAETILGWNLSSEEEERLIDLYIQQSGDIDIRRRLFVNKLIAGAWAIKSSIDGLFEVGHTPEARLDYHRRYLRGWEFLTVQSARFCGARRDQLRPPKWDRPLVVIDVDGVLDRRLFGWPCTTAEGVEALSLLSDGGFSIALNTARSVAEAKEYCGAYGLIGASAEHGAYVWDAVSQRGRRLLDDESFRQIEVARQHLGKIPGVFIDDRHRHSIRAYTFEKKPLSLLSGMLVSVRNFSIADARPVPLPTLLVSQLLSTLRLDRLSFHHTVIDTTILAKGVDKGTGMEALRDLISVENPDITAVGDSKPDIPMFRKATRSFAPAHIPCRREAELLGCKVAGRSYQGGLLEAAQTLVAKSRPRPTQLPTASEGEALFADILRAADRRNVRSLAGALLVRETYDYFIRR